MTRWPSCRKLWILCVRVSSYSLYIRGLPHTHTHTHTHTPTHTHTHAHTHTLAFTTGEVVKVRPSKVVAGHEADRTNEFLQILGIAILKEVRSNHDNWMC